MIHAAQQLSDDPVIWTFGVEDSTVSKHFIGLLRKAGYVQYVAPGAIGCGSIGIGSREDSA